MEEAMEDVEDVATDEPAATAKLTELLGHPPDQEQLEAYMADPEGMLCLCVALLRVGTHVLHAIPQIGSNESCLWAFSLAA